MYSATLTKGRLLVATPPLVDPNFDRTVIYVLEHHDAGAVGVVIKCRHLCMESRGIRAIGEETVTSAMLGELQPNLGLRTEFLALTRD